MPPASSVLPLFPLAGPQCRAKRSAITSRWEGSPRTSPLLPTSGWNWKRGQYWLPQSVRRRGAVGGEEAERPPLKLDDDVGTSDGGATFIFVIIMSS